MPGIKVRDNEGFESAMRRFKRIVEKSGILSEMRQREAYQSRSERKKRALAAAVKRLRKKQMRDGGGLFERRGRGPVKSTTGRAKKGRPYGGGEARESNHRHHDAD